MEEIQRPKPSTKTQEQSNESQNQVPKDPNDVTPEKQDDSKESGGSPAKENIVNNYYNYYINCPMIENGTGNRFSYDVPIQQFDDEMRAAEILKEIGKYAHTLPTSHVFRKCDADGIGVRPEAGSVNLIVSVKSREGLDRLWLMFSSGELEGLLKRDLPIAAVNISVRDYREGCKFFEELQVNKKKDMNEQGDDKEFQQPSMTSSRQVEDDKKVKVKKVKKEMSGVGTINPNENKKEIRLMRRIDKDFDSLIAAARKIVDRNLPLLLILYGLVYNLQYVYESLQHGLRWVSDKRQCYNALDATVCVALLLFISIGAPLYLLANDIDSQLITTDHKTALMCFSVFIYSCVIAGFQKKRRCSEWGSSFSSEMCFAKD